MATPRVERPASLQEYVALIEKYQATAVRSLWYRGVTNASYGLLPSLYRHRAYKKPTEFALLEKNLMLRFKQRSIPFMSRPQEDPWDKLFIMQHYGVPTRLLDWSENPFIGLYFALTGDDFTATGTFPARTLTFKQDAAVWLLDPIKWNRQVLSYQSYTGEIPFSDDAVLSAYKPPFEVFDDRNAAIAINGAHNSSRIVAQRGAFTISGSNTSSMDSAYDQRNFNDDSLIKVVIDKMLIPGIRKSILEHGFTEAVIYPDLDGLALEMRREFGFKD